MRRTVNISFKPRPRRPMTTPEKLWIRSLSPSTTLVCTRTLSPTPKFAEESLRNCSDSILSSNAWFIKFKIWNVGRLEHWNIGKLEECWNGDRQLSTIPAFHFSIIPVFHHSSIPILIVSLAVALSFSHSPVRLATWRFAHDYLKVTLPALSCPENPPDAYTVDTPAARG